MIAAAANAVPAVLALDAPLTADEERGFRLACRAMQLLGAEVAARAGVSLPGGRMVPETQVLRRIGAGTAEMARALELTLAR